MAIYDVTGKTALTAGALSSIGLSAALDYAGCGVCIIAV